MILQNSLQITIVTVIIMGWGSTRTMVRTDVTEQPDAFRHAAGRIPHFRPDCWMKHMRKLKRWTFAQKQQHPLVETYLCQVEALNPKPPNP